MLLQSQPGGHRLHFSRNFAAVCAAHLQRYREFSLRRTLKPAKLRGRVLSDQRMPLLQIIRAWLRSEDGYTAGNFSAGQPPVRAAAQRNQEGGLAGARPAYDGDDLSGMSSEGCFGKDCAAL